MSRNKKIELAYHFLRQQDKSPFTVRGLSQATGWSESTAKTYISKKYSEFLDREEENYFVNPKFYQLTLEDFINLNSQKNTIPLQDISKYTVKNQKDHPNIKGYVSYIDSIHVENYYCISDMTIDNLKDKKEIYFLGENGDGKTLLLQSIIFAFKRKFIEEVADPVHVANALSLLKDVKEKAIFSGTDASKNNYNDSYIKSLFAYGVSRFVYENTDTFNGFMSLFDDTAKLIDPIIWLKNLDYKKYKNEELPISLEDIIHLFEDMLGHGEKDVIIDMTHSTPRIIEKGTITSLDKLSAGYKSILIFLSDLLFHLIQSQPDSKNLNDFIGVVLVDEIGLHLHPKWELEIVSKLRKWFPQVQFIFTTHSPVVILGSSSDAIFYKIYKKEGKSYISEPIYKKNIKDYMANILVTSPLFDLESASMKDRKTSLN